MKITTILLLLTISLNSNAQSLHHISKNDIATMSLELTAGYAQGWREEVLYHPNALFKNFPNLNRNFWDSRISWQNRNIKDANHVLKAITTYMHIAAFTIKAGSLKDYKGSKKILKILFDLAKNYAAYQVGFFLSYNVTHKNKLF